MFFGLPVQTPFSYLDVQAHMTSSPSRRNAAGDVADKAQVFGLI